MSDQPAFPNTGNPTWGMEPNYGMDLRDWFAGQALVGMGTWMPHPTYADLKSDWAHQLRAEWAYAAADAMLAAREAKS